MHTIDQALLHTKENLEALQGVSVDYNEAYYWTIAESFFDVS
jgi:hypothetical protein